MKTLLLLCCIFLCAVPVHAQELARSKKNGAHSLTRQMAEAIYANSRAAEANKRALDRLSAEQRVRSCQQTTQSVLLTTAAVLAMHALFAAVKYVSCRPVFDCS